MKLCFVNVEIDKIFNWLSPKNVTAWLHLKEYHSTWWSEETLEVRSYFAQVWTDHMDKITNHFSKLERSIEQRGILSPISVVSGPPRDTKLSKVNASSSHFPPDYDLRLGLYTQPFGGSRITVAEKLGIETIPCVVHDFTNQFPNALVVNDSNYKDWFGADYVWCSSPPRIRLSKHSHITNTKYIRMNDATRAAQREAAKVARKEVFKRYG
jgi:hypothetical protein